jgi:rhamnosyltransferase
MKIAAAVILYNPEFSVHLHIRSYNELVEKVFVFDNTEGAPPKGFVSHDLPANCMYLTQKYNSGIALRLNEACNMALIEGFDWLLTMDQDSYFEDNSLTKYINCIAAFSNSSNVAVFGVNYEAQTDLNACTPSDKNQLITSGSLVNLKLFKSLGGFNEDLFIDQVDHEYCYRAKANGFRIVQFQNIFMHHSLGETTNRTSFKTLQSSSRSLHSPLRIYYMTRNSLYVRKRFNQDFKEEIDDTFKDLRIRIKNNLLYGKQKIATIKMVLQGYRDFRKNKMGKKQN